MARFEMIFTAAIAATAPIAAAAAIIDCPAQLPAEAVQVVRPAPGWTGFVPSFFRLQSIGVTLGRLQERGTLHGEYQELSQKAYRVSFPVADWKGEKWLMCEYVDGQIVQARRLPDDTQRCDVLYTPDKHGVFAIQVTCQMGRDRAPAGSR